MQTNQISDNKSNPVVNFVIGPPCSGKSTFIKNAFSTAMIIDLWDFQANIKYHTKEAVQKSYDDAENALREAIKSNNYHEIVLEHTLLRAERRKQYINMVKTESNATLNCFVMVPDDDTYESFCEQRNIRGPHTRIGRDILEIPSTSEGFDNVYVIVPKKDED